MPNGSDRLFRESAGRPKSSSAPMIHTRSDRHNTPALTTCGVPAVSDWLTHVFR